MNTTQPGKDARRTKKISARDGAANGWMFTVRRGTPSAEADERWANRSMALAAWLFEQYEQHRREQASRSETPITAASLDPSTHRATPVTGTVEAEGDTET